MQVPRFAPVVFPFLPAFFQDNKLMTSAGIVPADAPLNALDPTMASAFQIAGMRSTYAACDVLVESSTSAGIEMEGAGTFHMQNDARVSVAVCGNLTGQPELSDTISNKQLQVVYPTQHSVYRALA
jgi:hypothetical protein